MTYFLYIFPFQALIMRLMITSTYIFTLAFWGGKNYGCGGKIMVWLSCARYWGSMQKTKTTHSHVSCNPTLAKCRGEAQHLEKLEVWSPPGLPNVQSSTIRPKTPRIGVFLVSLERSWNVDVENGLALAIRTSEAQVMGKRRVGSQTGSLTPDH